MSETTPYYYHHDADGYYLDKSEVDYHPFDKNEDGSKVVSPAPYNATLIAVPDTIPEKKWPKFVDGAWTLVDNYIGEKYWLADRIQYTIIKYEVKPPEDALSEDPGPTLAEMKTAQIAVIYAAYETSCAADISFTTAAGVDDTYQASTSSIESLASAITSFTAENLPEGYEWKSATNKWNAFTYADLSGLAAAIAARTYTYFRKYQSLKDSVNACEVKEEVGKIVWSD